MKLDATNAWSGSVLHASPVPPLPYRTGRGYVAFCGEVVRNITRVAWSPFGGHRCAGCIATIARVNTLMELRGDLTETEFDL